MHFLRDPLPEARDRAPVRVIGCGNADRGDDGAGVLVARRVRAWGIDAREATSLLDAWEPGDDIVVVDAMVSGRDAGTIAVWDDDEVPAERTCRTSTHGVGISEAIGLARASTARRRGCASTGSKAGSSTSAGSSLRRWPGPSRPCQRGSRATPASRGSGSALHGAVQGVGFRPFVYRLASELGLRGLVMNSSSGLIVEVEGTEDDGGRFQQRLEPRGQPRRWCWRANRPGSRPLGYERFEIRRQRRVAAEEHRPCCPTSRPAPTAWPSSSIPPTAGYRYPFINCTNCGPRYTIVLDIPYDRARTTMRAFAMCADCARGVREPCRPALPRAADRLPRVRTAAGRGRDRRRGGAPCAEARIVALKGIGGFQLLVDARSRSGGGAAARPQASRGEAVRADDAVAGHGARHTARLSDAEERLLQSPAAPIVLLRSPGSPATSRPDVAHSSPYLGVMLPYSPLHHLLMGACAFPVVATSGNRSDEPIAIDNDEARDAAGRTSPTCS